MHNMQQAAPVHQAIVSEKIRVILKREAAANGGLRDMAHDIGEGYGKVWNQANRGQGILADLIVALARHGFDEPLRIVASAAGHDLTPKIKFLRAARSPAKPVRSTALELHHSCSVVTEAIETALVDGSFDDKDRDRVGAALYGLRKKMAEIEAKIQGEGR